MSVNWIAQSLKVAFSPSPRPGFKLKKSYDAKSEIRLNFSNSFSNFFKTFLLIQRNMREPNSKS